MTEATLNANNYIAICSIPSKFHMCMYERMKNIYAQNQSSIHCPCVWKAVHNRTFWIILVLRMQKNIWEVFRMRQWSRITSDNIGSLNKLWEQFPGRSKFQKTLKNGSILVYQNFYINGRSKFLLKGVVYAPFLLLYHTVALSYKALHCKIQKKKQKKKNKTYILNKKKKRKKKGYMKLSFKLHIFHLYIVDEIPNVHV